MGKHSTRFLQLCDQARTRIREVGIDDVHRQLEQNASFVLIDVREESEWAQGRLPKAVHLGKGIIERDIEATVSDMNTKIVLYCGGGFRSALAAESLKNMGYTEVSSMAGGYRQWKETYGFDNGNN